MLSNYNLLIVGLLLCCLVIQAVIAQKVYLLNAHRRINIILFIVCLLSVLCVAIEILLFFTIDIALANKMYRVYQFTITPIIFLIGLAAVEYLKNYSQRGANQFWNASRIIISICYLAVLGVLLVHGAPTAAIALSDTGFWYIKKSTITPSFLFHTYSSTIVHGLCCGAYVYLAFQKNSRVRQIWFAIFSFYNILIFLGAVYYIFFYKEGPQKSADLLTAFPLTIAIFLQVWVLAGFSLFEATPKNIYSDVLSSISNWIMILDENGRLKYINNIALKSSGINYADVDNRKVDEWVTVHTEGWNEDATWEFLKRQKDADYLEIEVLINQTNKVFNLQSSLKKIILPDGLEASLWILIDTTSIKSLQVQKAIIEAKSEEINSTYSDMVFLLDMTSHDLKTSLKTILDVINLMGESRQEQPKGSDLRYLEYAEALAEQSLSITYKLIDYIRVGVVPAEMAWHSVPNIIEQVKAKYGLLIEESKAVVQYVGIEMCYCNEWQLQQVFENLIYNSLKYKSILPPFIEIIGKEREVEYEMQVRDNGIGIKASFFARLFTKYSREPNSMVAGSGVGLSICKRILDKNEGRIWAESNNPLPGVSFHFTMMKKIPLQKKIEMLY